MLDPALHRLAKEAAYLGAEEERALIARAQAGDTVARDRVVLAHLRLALKLSSKRKGYSVPLDDLVQESMIGLIEALDRFDLDQPVRFATYATWWVRARLGDAAMRGHSLVRVNTSARKKALFFGLRTARAELEAARLPEAEIVAQLATRFDVDADTIREMTAYLAAGDSSLNVSVFEDGEEIGDQLVDPAPLPDELTDEAIDGPRRLASLTAALGKLSERERTIIEARVYTDAMPETLDTLGSQFGISKERVRQIEVRALQKMKAMLTSEPVQMGADRPRKRGRSTTTAAEGRVAEIARSRFDCPIAERETVVALSKRLGLSRNRIYQIEAQLRRDRELLAA